MAMEKEKYLNGTVAVVGLGYVGLPLAVAFAEHMPTIGFDISAEKIELLSLLVYLFFEVNKSHPHFL